MRKSLRKLLFGLTLICCVYQSKGYAQERDLSIVVIPTKSTMLSEEILATQSQFELDKIVQLDEAERAALYETLPDRSIGEVQHRMMTYETQKGCRGVSRDYKIDIRFIHSSAVNSLWDFGDGKPAKHIPIEEGAGTLATTYIYDVPGIYTIEILFFDSAFRPVNSNERKIKVIIEACSPPSAPQLSVNPNIHKVTIE
ncbi:MULTISPECIES: hypothetical protein [unclassified Myroides]|uniref:hypothetical protein n=1 Tax=unclassified Myroides TaxID=2642485 RepID=UPI003D2F7381